MVEESNKRYFVATFSRSYNIGECLQILKPNNKLFNSPQEAALSKKDAIAAYVWEVGKTDKTQEWKIRSFLGSHTVNLPRQSSSVTQ